MIERHKNQMRLETTFLEKLQQNLSRLNVEMSKHTIENITKAGQI